LIPKKHDILGANVIILSATAFNKEFYRCGYYVYNYYADENLWKTEQEDPNN